MILLNTFCIASEPFPERSVLVSTDGFETSLLDDRENLCTSIEVILNDYRGTKNEEDQIPETIAFDNSENDNDFISENGSADSQQINSYEVVVDEKHTSDELLLIEAVEEDNHEKTQEEKREDNQDAKAYSFDESEMEEEKSLRVIESSLDNEELKPMEQGPTSDETESTASTSSTPTQNSDIAIETFSFLKRESKVAIDEDSSSTQILRSLIKRDKEIAAKRKEAIARARSKPNSRLPGKKTVTNNVSVYSRHPKRAAYIEDEKTKEGNISNVSNSSNSQSKTQVIGKGKKKKSLRSFLERDREITKKRQESLLKARQGRSDLFHKDERTSTATFQISDDASLSSVSTARSTSSRLEQLYQKGKNDRRNDLEKSIRDKVANIGGGADHHNDDASEASVSSSRSTPLRFLQLYEKGKEQGRKRNTNRDMNQFNDDISVSNALSSRSSTPLRFQQLYEKGKNERRSDLKRSIQAREIADDNSISSSSTSRSRRRTPFRLEQLYEKSKKEMQFNRQRPMGKKGTHANSNQIADVGLNSRFPNRRSNSFRLEPLSSQSLLGSSRFNDLYRLLETENFSSLRHKGSEEFRYDFNEDDRSTSSSVSTLSCASRRLNQLYEEGRQKKLFELRKFEISAAEEKKDISYDTSKLGTTMNRTCDKLYKLSQRNHEIGKKRREDIENARQDIARAQMMSDWMVKKKNDLKAKQQCIGEDLGTSGDELTSDNMSDKFSLMFNARDDDERDIGTHIEAW